MQKETNYSEMDLLLLAGRILLESGAEIYRVEETMTRMAEVLELDQFGTYVVNRAIVTSALNAKGLSESRTMTVAETSINLGRLEAVNTFSRNLSQHKAYDIASLYQELQNIETSYYHSDWQVILAYFAGAGFSLALGSTAGDSLASALTGALLGCFFQMVTPYIQTRFLLNIFGASFVALIANLLYFGGLGQHRSLIILGTLMVMIPGAFFVNAIREFSQNNYFTGLSLSMSALLTCSAISAGVAVTIAFLPFADQMTSTFTQTELTPIKLLVQILSAGFGTVAFSILYQTPKRHFLDLGILGGLTWGLYRILWHFFQIEALAVFVPALLVAAVSRILAIKRKSPATIFLSTSMFPLIPGLSFYRGIYFFLTGSEVLAIEHLQSSFITAFTITIAVTIVQQVSMKRFIRNTVRSKNLKA
ncbi:threonine/serine exporter ThrE family protein [Streptococcus merionis]|uniref:threonine/serine ThrE exporter family protein n=1 Tax=Streptococcus merionis TaxID=400065 RepID=UPI0026EA7C33|nr:threonine/serine exporter family protein [Streptococcus merionis]